MGVRGRPRTVDQADVRDLIVTFRVNQGEYRQLQALAMGVGSSIGELLRSLVADQVGRQGRSPQDRRAAARRPLTAGEED